MQDTTEMDGEQLSDEDEHICDSKGNVTMGMTPEGLVERIRCSVCDGVVFQRLVNG